VTEAPAARGVAPLLYLVTDRHATAGRPLAGVVAAALEGFPPRLPRSALAVQLREKDLDGRALTELGRQLGALTAAAGVRLFVNDRVDVALAVGADGVHLGGGALTPADVRAVAAAAGRGAGLEIAVSTHAAAEVARAAHDGGIAFAVFGPVYVTPSKRAYGPPQGLEALGAAAAAAAGAGLPVVAIGGIGGDDDDGRDRIQACLSAGAAGVGCIRAILSAARPDRALARIFEAIETT